MNKEMQKSLETLVGTDTLVSVYTDSDEPHSFTLGYLLQMDDENVLINMVDSYGEENGFCTIWLDKIVIFGGDKGYLEKIKKLFELKKQKRRYIEKLDTNPLVSFLQHAVDNSNIIMVNEDDDFTGYVINFSSDILELQMIDYYCNDLGIATIDMQNVKVLESGKRTLRDLELLSNINWKW